MRKARCTAKRIQALILCRAPERHPRLYVWRKRTLAPSRVRYAAPLPAPAAAHPCLLFGFCLSFSIALVTLARLRRLLGFLPAVGSKGTADIIALVELAFRVAPHVALVRSGVDQFASRHVVLNCCAPTEQRRDGAPVRGASSGRYLQHPS